VLPIDQITLDCPSCHAPLTRSLDWFKQTYFTCPECGAGLAASQFSSLIADLEAALDENIEEMMQGKSSGCGCGKGGCGGH